MAPPATRDALITSLVQAAKADGLTPVVEGHTVDLRILRNDHVVAAIRVHLEEGCAWYEAPARTGSGLNTGVFFRSWGSGLFRPEDMDDLTWWWSRIPQTGRTWSPKPKPWAKPGYWRSRLGDQISF